MLLSASPSLLACSGVGVKKLTISVDIGVGIKEDDEVDIREIEGVGVREPPTRENNRVDMREPSMGEK